MDKRAFVGAMAAKRRKKSDLDLDMVESKANLFSNEEMSESPFMEPMSDEEELDESGFLPESEMDNIIGHDDGGGAQKKDNILEKIMRSVRMRNMGK